MLRLKPKPATIPIILCTGAMLEVTALSAHFETLGIRIVLKPFKFAQLLELATQTLSAASSTADQADPLR